MNILFFLEPSVEHNNPVFRYATLRNSIVPQAKVLCKTNNVVLICNNSIAEKAISDNYSEYFHNICAIEPLKWSSGESSSERLMRLQKREYKYNEIDGIKRILNELLPKGFVPDLIISWESPVYFFEEIFSKAKCLYQMPGFFSRPPYPNLIYVDIGLLEHRNLSDELYHKTGNSSMKTNINLNYIRELDLKFLTRVSPLNKTIDRIYSKFQKVVLFPLQVDDYFMVNNVISSRSNQLECIIEILNNTPRDIGVWVTNYKSKDIKTNILSTDIVASLRRIYPNFIYIESCDEIPYVSQFLVPRLDGVISISSSVGFQAAYFEKPLFCLEDIKNSSHISDFATCDSYEEFISQIRSNSNFNQDIKIYHKICYHHLSGRFTSSDKYNAWLKSYVKSGILTPWIDDVEKALLFLRRESNLLKEIRFFDKKKADIDYCVELSNQIRKHDIISFDIFDTLLFRPFSTPTDLFKFIDEEAKEIIGDKSFDFLTSRREAEKKAFQSALSREEFETSITEIYQILARESRISISKCNKLMRLEMDAEKSLLYPRLSAFNAFQEALELGKRIIIVSDMYLPTEFLEQVLKENGYIGYERIYVSSKYKVKKHNGKLFDKVIEDLNVLPGTILHIGDNFEADIKQAKLRGIKAFHLVRSSEIFKNSSDYVRPWARDDNNHSIHWKMVLSVIGQRLHDNPYLPHRKGTLFGGDAWKLGYYGFGTLLLGYVKWLVEHSINNNIDELYFLSRDGKIMKEAYDLVAKLYNGAPKSKYLLCSRRAVNLAKVKGIEDILDLLYVDFSHKVKLSHLLTHRFGVNYSDIDHDILSKYGFSWDNSRLTKDDLPLLRKLFIELQDVLLLIAKKERAAYLNYLNQVGLFDSKRKNAIVDIGYAGTMQQSLYQLSGKRKKIDGYYLITFRQAILRLEQNGLNSFGYLASFIDRHDTYHPFCRYVPLYETMFSSCDTSFIKMIENYNSELKPVYMERSSAEQERCTFVKKCHRGALDFVEDNIRIFNKHFYKLDFEPNKSIRTLNLFFSNPHPKDARILSGISFEDSYGGRGEVVLLPLDNDLMSDKKVGIWKEGIEIIKKDLSKIGIDNAKEDSARDRNTKQKLLVKIMSLFLNDKKKRKLLEHPELFFYDSRSKFVKYLESLYFN